MEEKIFIGGTTAQVNGAGSHSGLTLNASAGSGGSAIWQVAPGPPIGGYPDPHHAGPYNPYSAGAGDIAPSPGIAPWSIGPVGPMGPAGTPGVTKEEIEEWLRRPGILESLPSTPITTKTLSMEVNHKTVTIRNLLHMISTEMTDYLGIQVNYFLNERVVHNHEDRNPETIFELMLATFRPGSNDEYKCVFRLSEPGCDFITYDFIIDRIIKLMLMGGMRKMTEDVLGVPTKVIDL